MCTFIRQYVAKKTTLEKVNQQVKSDPPRNKKVLWDTKILVLITLKVATK